MTALDELATVPFHDADTSRRTKMLSQLAAMDLYVALKPGTEEDEAEFRMLPLADEQVVAAFETEVQATDFFGEPVEGLRISGRWLAVSAKANDHGILVNPGYPSEMLLDASMLDSLIGPRTALDELAATPFHDADAPQRARMLSRLADTEVFVALEAEPVGDDVQLRIFPSEEGKFALGCDSEDRLADFFGQPVDYVGLPGRVLAGLLRAEGAGLLVNPGHASEMLLDASMLDWLSDALAGTPQADEAHLRLIGPDKATADALAQPLAVRLADLRGLISGAALVGVAGLGGVASHLLLISGAEADRQPQIAKALAEALAFLPPQPGGVDISFVDNAVTPGALLFDLTPPEAPVPPKSPKGPPILR